MNESLKQVAEVHFASQKKWQSPLLTEFDLNYYKQQKTEYLKRYDQMQSASRIHQNGKIAESSVAQGNAIEECEYEVDPVNNKLLERHETVEQLELQIKQLNRKNGFLLFRIQQLENAISFKR